MRTQLAKHSLNKARGARHQGRLRIKFAIETNGHHIQLRWGGGAQAPPEMNGQLRANLGGHKRSIEEPFWAIVWLVREVSKPHPGIKWCAEGQKAISQMSRIHGKKA